MKRDGPADGAQPSGPGGDEHLTGGVSRPGSRSSLTSGSTWRPDLRRRTRMYHEETGDDTMFPG